MSKTSPSTQTKRWDALLRDIKSLQLSKGQPEASILKNAPLIENWFVDRRSDGPSLLCLVGNVTGHPRLPDGITTTSPLVVVDPALKWARTVGRYYKLGRRAPFFAVDDLTGAAIGFPIGNEKEGD
jgi:hypothetical protein